MTSITPITPSTASVLKRRRTAFVAPKPPPCLISATSTANSPSNRTTAITNLLDADPEFYLHVEQVSLEKLRRDAMDARASTREAHPAAAATTVQTKPVNVEKPHAHRGDVRWRTLVRLSYQKAKFCARLLRVGQKENSRRATSAVPPRGGLEALGVGVTPLRCASLVELSVTVQKEEEKQPLPVMRRGRSRSDAFIIPNNLWRPNVAALLSNSAPAATPSAVSCVAEWVPPSPVLAA